jgi:antitoxin (DNA-binding transcriptional repressor) of toxin-antitoxin stability system
MKAVERTGVKNLKNNLSLYLRHVRRGVRVLVTDRDEVVAEIEKPRPENTRDPILAEWIASGAVRPARTRKRKLPKPPVHLPEGTSRRLLDAERGE